MFYVDKIIDETTGVTITALSGFDTLDLRTRVIVENQESLAVEYQGRVADGKQLKQVLDIRLILNDLPVEFMKHPVRIMIPIEEALKGRDIEIIYFAKSNLRLVDGDIIVPDIKEGIMSFTIDSDGYNYGVAVKESTNSNSGNSSGSGSNTDGKRGRDPESGVWQKNVRGWWYQRPDLTWPQNQWEMIRGLWYYFDKDGYMMSGWQTINNRKYYLCSDGHMVTGWLLNNGKWYYMHEQGDMLSNQWIKYHDNWYYLGTNGEMMINEMTPDGFQLDENGIRIQ